MRREGGTEGGRQGGREGRFPCSSLLHYLCLSFKAPLFVTHDHYFLFFQVHPHHGREIAASLHLQHPDRASHQSRTACFGRDSNCGIGGEGREGGGEGRTEAAVVGGESAGDVGETHAFLGEGLGGGGKGRVERGGRGGWGGRRTKNEMYYVFGLLTFQTVGTFNKKKGCSCRSDSPSVFLISSFPLQNSNPSDPASVVRRKYPVLSSLACPLFAKCVHIYPQPPHCLWRPSPCYLPTAASRCCEAKRKMCQGKAKVSLIMSAT